MAAFEGNSLVGWSIEYVNSLLVARSYIEELEQKPIISPQEYSKYALLIECQKIIGDMSKSCISTILKEKMFNIGELTEAFVLLEPYLFGAGAANTKKHRSSY